MRKGKALISTATGISDFSGGDVVTMYPGGPGKMIEVMKCEQCGKSLSLLSDAAHRENLLQHGAVDIE